MVIIIQQWFRRPTAIDKICNIFICMQNVPIAVNTNDLIHPPFCLYSVYLAHSENRRHFTIMEDKNIFSPTKIKYDRLSRVERGSVIIL